MAITFINWIPHCQFHFPIPDRAEKSAIEKLQLVRRGWSKWKGVCPGGGGGGAVAATLNLAKCWPRMRIARVQQNCWNLIPQGLLQRAMHNSWEWVEEGGGKGGWGRDFKYEVEAESGTRTSANAERLVCIDKLTQQPRVDCLPLLPFA